MVQKSEGENSENFSPGSRKDMKINPRELLLEIFQAGLDAVAPGPALLSHLTLEDGAIKAGGRVFNLPEKGVYVAGGGKGAAPMAAALENLLGDKIRDGVIVVKYGHDLDLDKIRVLQASHPTPDEAGAKAAKQCLDMAASCEAGDLLICLLTGGASALLPSPAEPLSLEDLKAVTSHLLACGANIEEINTIRKHLSSLSGGRLAKAANGAQVLALIVSDVPGDDPAAIASGPCAPDPSTYADCLKIIAKYQLEEKLPPEAMRLLREGLQGKIPETPKAGDPVFENAENIIIASNSQALTAAARKSEALGLDARILQRPMEGEAALCAENLIEQALKIQEKMSPSERPICLIAGGETTVSLSGDGKGGRNQEMALAAAIALDGHDGIYCLFGGTDGTDGPTDAAGGFASGASAAKIGGMESARGFLANHDSYEALKKAGESLVTGPTRTNVMDMAVIIIEPLKK